MLRGLDAELGELGGENEEEQDLEEEDEPDPAIHQAELEAKVKKLTGDAISAKKAGDT